MERLHPGVYIEEIPSGVRPIEGVSTSTAAFLGKAERGPDDRALLITSFSEFTRHYGDFLKGFYLAHAALNFFDNGGRRLYVARVVPVVAGEGVTFAKVATTSMANRQSAEQTAATVEASSLGAWGNTLELEVSDSTADPANEFRLTVREHRPDGVQTETFDDLSIVPSASNFIERVVAAQSRLVRVTVPEQASDEKGTSVSGPSPATTLKDLENPRFLIQINGDLAQPVTLGGEPETGEKIAEAIKDFVKGLEPRRPSVPKAAYESFEAAFVDGVYQLTSGTGGPESAVVVTSDPNVEPELDAAKLLKLGTTNEGKETTAAAILRPAVRTYFLTGGEDGTTPASDDYKKAFALLDPITDVNIVAVPGIGDATVVAEGSSYCERRKDCFLVADVPNPNVTTTAVEARDFVNKMLAVKSSYAGLYFPWLKAIDPAAGATEPTPLPPSGAVCGIYARIDSRRGVWKAPAGTEANVAGAVGLATAIGNVDQDILNPVGVNAIRFFPASGIVIWGARTLATRSDPEYRYVPVRRFAIFLEQSIYNGIQWAVFEPNDEDLWASLRLNIGAFMMNLFRAGAFQGETPSKAFFVKCDPETNPQDQIDAGIVTVLVGFAPLKPAEFVVIRISQKTAEAAA
jgi:uncharacterized protein